VMRKTDLNEEDEEGFIDQLTMLIRLWKPKKCGMSLMHSVSFTCKIV
jgi:hypothetical protein